MTPFTIWRSFVLAVLAGGLPFAFINTLDRMETAEARVILVAAAVLGLGAFALAVVDYRRGRTRGWVLFFSGLVGVAGALWNAFLAVLIGMTFAHGRPFRRRGQVVTAGARRGGGWLDDSATGVAPGPDAGRWTRDGLAEHASVAAFAQVTLDLLAVGAPAELVEAATAAQRDEIIHARHCFALASAYAGRPIGPGPLDGEEGTLVARRRQLALDSLRDGCWHEQASADALHAAAQSAADPVVASVLGRLAADEDRHAALAWAIVAFCVREDPTLRAALLAEDAALQAKAPPGDPLAAACASRLRALLQ